jgi:hypothetical protein
MHKKTIPSVNSDSEIDLDLSSEEIKQFLSNKKKNKSKPQKS